MEIRIRVERPRWLKVPRRRSAKVGIVLVAALFVAVPLAWADHTFDDVPAASPHHADISTIARIGITVGCNPPTNNLYCPDAAVRRDQMGSFIARTLRALTPVFLRGAGGAGILDIDTGPVICQTGSHTATVAKHARVDSWFSAVPAAGALMTFGVRNVYSTNGGTNWNSLDLPTDTARAGTSIAGNWVHATNSGLLILTAGTTYVFGVQIVRQAPGTTDPGDHRCEVIAQITYRDAFAAGAGVNSDRLDR